MTFVVKRREFIEQRQTMYGRVASYGPWRTLGKYATIEEARARRNQETRGLFQAVVLLGGKIVVDSTGWFHDRLLDRIIEKRGERA